MFIDKKTESEVNVYIDLLKMTGSLSNLFSESKTPYLYYRLAENIFCKAFAADNLSRSDCSADARKNKLGFGIKTFVSDYDKSFQKIAEFNKEFNNENLFIKQLLTKPKSLAVHISELRNYRLEVTQEVHNLDRMIFHCIARRPNKFLIFEENMDVINIDKIKVVKMNKTSLIFSDGLNEYNFLFSKSTLFKKFIIKNAVKVDIQIINDPFSVLEQIRISNLFSKEKEHQSVVLPLYSMDSGQVELKSGLNQWNAGGRKRKSREVYIPVPIWVHKHFPYFFPDINKVFDIKLPNKRILKAKMCQTCNMKIDNRVINKGKGLMSNPNTDLGEWLLEDILRMPEKELVTKEILLKAGIDSVEVRKIDNETYELDFKKAGTFEEFVLENSNE